MGEMELFFKCNKENRENREMPVCSTLKDEMVMWLCGRLDILLQRKMRI